MPMPNPLQILVPTVIEEGSRGDRAFDIYSQLLRERIVFLGQEVDDQVANLIISQILFLEAHDPEKDIYLYINSPGGQAYAGMAIYDVMQHVAPDVSTICVGMGMSAAAMILCGGAAGKRFSLPNARIMIHQGSAGTRGATGQDHGRRRHPHPHTDGGDVAVDVLHDVVDGHPGVGHAAGRVDVHGDVAVGVLGVEVEDLGHQQVGDLVVHLLTQEDDALFQQQ